MQFLIEAIDNLIKILDSDRVYEWKVKQWHSVIIKVLVRLLKSFR